VRFIKKILFFFFSML